MLDAELGQLRQAICRPFHRFLETALSACLSIHPYLVAAQVLGRFHPAIVVLPRLLLIVSIRLAPPGHLPPVSSFPRICPFRLSQHSPVSSGSPGAWPIPPSDGGSSPPAPVC